MAGLSANERRIVELVLKATGDADLKRMVAELKATRTAAEGAQQSLGGMSAGLSAAGKFASGFIASLGVSTIISWGRAILDTADALDAAAEQAGIGIERYQTLKQAFRALEVDAGEFQTGMEKLGVVLSDVLEGNVTAATKALDTLGVKSKIVSGEITDQAGLVDALANSHKALANDITLTTDLAAIFGKKLAGDYSSAFRSGQLATEELRVSTENFGVVSEQEMAKLAAASETVDQAYNTVSNAIQIAAANTITWLEKMYHSLSDENAKAIADAHKLATVSTKTGGSTTGGGGGWGAPGPPQAPRSQGGLTHALDRLALGAPVIPSHPRAGGGGGGGGGALAAAERERQAAAKAETDRVNRRLAEQADLQKAMLAAWLAEQKALEAQARTYEEAADPLRAYNREMAELSALTDRVTLSAPALAEAQAGIEERYRAATQAIYENSDAFHENQKALEAQRKHAEAVREEWEYLANVVGQATYDIISGTESISQAVKKMVAAVLAEVARLAAIKLAAQIVTMLFGGTGGVGKSAGTVGTGSPKLFAQGGILTGPTFVAAGAGGIGIAGEAGPEVVAPLRRDASGNMGVGAIAPRVVVNNYAGAEVRTTPTADGVQIDIMRRVIADDIRRGGNPVASAIEGAYRVGRQAGAFG